MPASIDSLFFDVSMQIFDPKKTSTSKCLSRYIAVYIRINILGLLYTSFDIPNTRRPTSRSFVCTKGPSSFSRAAILIFFFEKQREPTGTSQAKNFSMKNTFPARKTSQNDDDRPTKKKEEENAVEFRAKKEPTFAVRPKNFRDTTDSDAVAFRCAE